MKVVYFGTAAFAVPGLERIAEHVCLVVSQPDKASGRGLETRPSPVKAKALELGLRVVTPAKCRTAEFVEEVRGLGADLNVVAAYGQILPESLLGASARGSVNLHGSLLPRWRGAAPVQRAIEAGDVETGVTLMQMDAGLDTGDIIAMERTPIGLTEVAGEVYDRLSHMAGEMIEAWLPLLVSGSYPREKQDDSLSSHAAKVTKEDGRLSGGMDARVAYDKFRAFTPVPGAYVETSEGPLKLLRAAYVPGSLAVGGAVLGGTVVGVRPSLVVAFADGCLNLLEVQPAGRKRMEGSAFANGARIGVGVRLFE